MSVPFLLALLMHVGGWAASPALPTREFINPQAPPAKIPSYNGDRYEAVVPDTLDIAERARLAVQGMTNLADPADNYHMYWLVNYWNWPPLMQREQMINIRGKLMETLPLLRIASGSMINGQVEQAWMDGLLKSIGPDGLVYCDFKHNDRFLTLPAYGTGRVMGAMMVFYLRDQDPVWLERVGRIVERLSELAIDGGDYAYLPDGQYPLNMERNPDSEFTPGYLAVDTWNGRVIRELG